jgi:hypothetical protein
LFYYASRISLYQLTEYEANNTASKVHETTEEVNNEVDYLGGEIEGELGRLLEQCAGSREERPYELDQRSGKVAESLDDGRHVD